MKRIYCLLACMACMAWLGAQEGRTVSVDLQWRGTERWSIGDSLHTDVIALEQASYEGEHHLPHYRYELPADGRDTYRAELAGAVYVPLTEEELRLLPAGVLPAEPRVETYVSRSRDSRTWGVSVLPFAVREGQAVKLQSFDLVLTKAGQAAPTPRRTYARQSVLSQGRFVKLRVQESGLYRLTYDQLRSKGIDPANVRLFGYGGAVLDEDFSLPGHDDLPEVAVYDTGREILFYAQGVNKWRYDAGKKKYVHEINPYSQYGHYFVTSDNVGEKKRIGLRPEYVAYRPEDVRVFTDYAVYEKEKESFNRSGRKLYEPVTTGGRITASFRFPALKTDRPVEVRTEAEREGSFSLSLNGRGSQSVSAHGTSDKTFAATSDHLSFTLSYSGMGKGYLDYIEVNVWRDPVMTGASMVMHNRENIGGDNRYHLSGAGSSVRVWDINDLTEVREMTVERTGTDLSFADAAETAKSYLAVDMDRVAELPSPALLDEVPAQNLHGMASADMLVIAHPLFVPAAQTLAQAHAEIGGLAVAVVTADQVYNEFSSGTPDATAYRRMAQMLYERADRPLRYLLLFGKGSFDNRGLLSGAGDRMLLTYQSVNSVAEDRESYTTDDYFGFLDDGEGTSLGRSDKLDIGIGRFPVVTEEQARGVVEKTIRYMRNEQPGAWKNHLCFLGDDGDANRHMSQSNAVADSVARRHRAYNINKIMFDAFQQEVNASGQSYPLAKNKFDNLIRKGLLYINYMGHANINGWSNENILLTQDIKQMRNRYLPLVSAGTCEFSRYDKEYVCGGEALVTNPQGGAIGCFSATRSVYPGPNHELMEHFAETLFAYAADGSKTIGDAVMHSKNLTANDAPNTLSYVYFGDPAVRLQYPNSYEVAVQAINGTAVAGTDTLRALSETTLTGRVLDTDGSPASNFEGTLQLVVLDKEERITCFNNDREPVSENDPTLITPFEYDDRPNTIFKGTVPVQGGRFTTTFKLPKDIKYNYGSGRMVFTVWDGQGREGGQGFYEDFTVGGSSDGTEEVTAGPEVEMYLNHRGFVSGGRVNETPVFTAHVRDEYGVNISSPTPGHDIMLVLDGNRSFVLNDYYESELDTYKAGTVTYQLPELDEGHYSLMFRVWNLYNVSTIGYLDFEVVRDLSPEIFSVSCYPNPATTETTIRVKHDREDDIIDMTVEVYDLSGKLLWTRREQATEAIAWDLTTGNGPLAPGMYIYRVSVKTDRKILSSRANKLLVVR